MIFLDLFKNTLMAGPRQIITYKTALSLGFIRNVQAKGPRFEIYPEKLYSGDTFRRDKNALYRGERHEKRGLSSRWAQICGLDGRLFREYREFSGPFPS